MPWRFDPFLQEIFWVQPVLITEGVGDISMGEANDADITIDLGSRDDTPSQIDQGLRIYDGDV
jgi:hypothetical protein